MTENCTSYAKAELLARTANPKPSHIQEMADLLQQMTAEDRQRINMGEFFGNFLDEPLVKQAHLVLDKLLPKP